MGKLIVAQEGEESILQGINAKEIWENDVTDLKFIESNNLQKGFNPTLKEVRRYFLLQPV
ncbi:MAG: hypothetical protein CM1200mP40_25270 [Gammaproteobacteria bacterium]|nr:MAG: hypothetical protein CM1200mP40_25270 [Gammaproteobacteria bacterium]